MESPLFLVIQSTYSHVEYAFFSGHTCLGVTHIDKKQASETLVPLLSDTLGQLKYTLEDLNFIGVNQGPAPFTTLRVVIATVNGISFATHTPLIGIDGLQALIQEYASEQLTVALLNAFNKEVYYAIADNGVILAKGYQPIDTLITTIKKEYFGKPLHCIGNGTILYHDKLISGLGSNVHIPEKPLLFCSIQQLAKSALHQWNVQTLRHHRLLPLYLKS